MKFDKRQMAAYGLGAIGKDMVYALSASYVMYYYQDLLGISATFVGLILMIARIFDALNDPFMGVLVAKTNTKWGRFRPWLLSGTLLNAFVLFALFSAGSLQGKALMTFFSVVYILWGVTYTMMDIPYWSMIPAVTDNAADREGMSVVGRTCAGVGNALITIFTVMSVKVLGSGNEVVGFGRLALIVAVLFVVSEYDLGGADWQSTYTIFSSVGGGSQILGMMLVYPMLRKRLGNTQIFTICQCTAIMGYAMLLATCLAGLSGSLPVLLVPGLLVFMSNGILTVLTTVFLSGTVDYGELKTGHREESVIFSMQTFVVKAASGFAVFMTGVGLDIIGLVGNTDQESMVVEQSAQTLMGLRLLMTLIPIAGLLIALLVFKRKFILTDEKAEEIALQLRKRRKA